LPKPRRPDAGNEGANTMNALEQLGERIRRIVCTTLDEATARREIEAAIQETAQALNVPALAVGQGFTNELLKLPLKKRVKKLSQRGHQIPKEWTTTH
jgi:hypothetical protein